MHMSEGPIHSPLGWLAACLVLLAAIGCSSKEPTISGFGLGASRAVSVGDTFEIRLPVGENGERLWRITSYDSYFLTVAANTRAETTSDGSAIVMPILARQVGDTTIEVTERVSMQDRAAGREPRTKTFKVQIIQ